VSTRRGLAVAGVVLSIAGVALGVSTVLQQRAKAVTEGRRLFGQLSTVEDTEALVQLSRSALSIRRAFLEQALGSDASAQPLLRHLHGASIALSRVDSGDARSLYQDVIRKRLLDAPPGDVIEACTFLLVQWDLASEMPPSDAALVAGRMVERMETDTSAGRLERYAPLISVLAPRLTSQSADPLMARLFKLAVASDSANGYDAVAAVIAIAPRTSGPRRREYADKLMDRLSGERRHQTVITLARMLAPLSIDAASAGESVAGDTSGRIVQRMVTAWDATDVEAFLPVLRSVAPKTNPADAERDTRLLLRGIEIQLKPSVLLSFTEALNCFGDRAPLEIYQQAAEMLLKRIRVETNEGDLVTIASSLGVLNHKATKAQFTEAAEDIVGRFTAAKDMMADAALAGAIEAVADELPPPVAEKLSSQLVGRMLEERRTGSLLYIAAALDDIADEVQQPGADALTGRLLTRLRRESNPASLRTLAFSIAAFFHSTANADAAAAVLASRIADEDDPDDVRRLASGLFALRNQAAAKYYDLAAASIANQIETRVKPDEIADLAVSFYAMSSRAGPEPFERAASAIVANVNQVQVLAPSLARVAPYVRTPKANELIQTLVGRIAREQDPGKLRALGNELAAFPEVHAETAVEKLMSIPDAPCQIAPPSTALLNPLCSESSWDASAADVLHLHPAPRDPIESDFAQLSADDDDDARPSGADKEPAFDFGRLSDALTSSRARAPIPDESTMPWAGMALVACGLAALVAAALTRT
jgi:hypothetical protein